jgi:phosphatidylglycerol---prolipoprotein diacylglyceryl transferase
MLKHPEFDPVAFTIFSWPVHWYGLMYLFSFLLIGYYLVKRLKKASYQFRLKISEDISTQQRVEDIIFYAVLGVVLGGRIGFILFYQFAYYKDNFLDILKLWQGGMSFHGGLLGVIIALAIYAKKEGIRYLDLMDFLAPAVPIGLGLGRLGNFINGELWGRVTSDKLPWAMVFPKIDEWPRHPSPIYQMLVEGILLFLILWAIDRYLSNKDPQNQLLSESSPKTPKHGGYIAASFLIFYGLGRIFTELFREPDYFLGFKMGLTMGQWLSVPMVLLGLGIALSVYLKNKRIA